MRLLSVHAHRSVQEVVEMIPLKSTLKDAEDRITLFELCNHYKLTSKTSLEHGSREYELFLIGKKYIDQA